MAENCRTSHPGGGNKYINKQTDKRLSEGAPSLGGPQPQEATRESPAHSPWLRGDPGEVRRRQYSEGDPRALGAQQGFPGHGQQLPGSRERRYGCGPAGAGREERRRLNAGKRRPGSPQEEPKGPRDERAEAWAEPSPARHGRGLQERPAGRPGPRSSPPPAPRITAPGPRPRLPARHGPAASPRRRHLLPARRPLSLAARRGEERRPGPASPAPAAAPRGVAGGRAPLRLGAARPGGASLPAGLPPAGPARPPRRPRCATAARPPRAHQHRASRRVRPRPPAPSASAGPGSAAVASPRRAAARRAPRRRPGPPLAVPAGPGRSPPLEGAPRAGTGPATRVPSGAHREGPADAAPASCFWVRSVRALARPPASGRCLCTYPELWLPACPRRY